MAEENRIKSSAAKSSDIEIDMDVLQQQEKTTTSLCDRYGVHVFNEDAVLLEEKALQQKEEQREKILADVINREKNSDREEVLKRIMEAETSQVIKKEYGLETQKNQDLSVYVFGLIGMLLAGIILFHIEKWRKGKRKRT